MRKWLAIDIGGTFVKYGIINEKMEIEKRWKAITPEIKSSDFFYNYICQKAVDIEDVTGIGVCAPGLIDENYVIKSFITPKLDKIRGTNIAFEIEKRMHLNVTVINDAKAAGLCELKLGNAKGTKSSAFLIIGTGTGGCICNGNDVIYGVDGFAGEFHFVPFISDEGKQTVWKRGRVSSTQGLVELYNAKAKECDKIQYGKDVIEKYLAGEALAQDVVDDWIFKLAVHLFTVIVSINPEVLCIGGGISEEDWFLEKLKCKYEKICDDIFQGIDFLTTRIMACKYHNDANLLGAVLKYINTESK